MKKLAAISAAISILLLLGACAANPPTEEQPAPPPDRPHKLTAAGRGLTPDNFPPARAKLLAQEAAYVAAERELCKKLYELSADGPVTVEKYIEGNGDFSTYVKGYLRGVKKVRATDLKDGYTVEAEVELELDEFWRQVDASKAERKIENGENNEQE